MAFDPEKGRAERAAFLQRYPLESLRDMTLEEYTNLEPADSFTYILERRTKHAGSIKGGSSYKFGIYRRANTEKEVIKPNLRTDGVYGWMRKYGEDRVTAWANVRKLVVQTAELARAGDYEAIDAINLGQVYRWKLAFMYSQEGLLPIYDYKMLLEVAAGLDLDLGPKPATSALQRAIYERREADEDVYEAAMRLLTAYSTKDSDATTSMSTTSQFLNRSSSMPTLLNQILYGPPGTGKTYRTITDAVKIANPDFAAPETDRSAWTAEYQRLVEAGRIVFTTFHQSMSYEDFVEGLKPKLTQEEEGDVSYEIKAGLFRKLCLSARIAVYDRFAESGQEIILDYGERFDAYVAYVQEKIDAGETVPVRTKAGRGAVIVGVSDRGNLLVKHENGERDYIVSKDRQVRLDEGIADFDNIEGNIYTLFGSIIGGSNASVHWAVMNAVREHTPASVPSETIKERIKPEKAVRDMDPSWFQRPNLPNYVLIIDEINRGNVSRIFGELITLLEPDKRLGRAEELKVTLPYSGDSFGVPPNLYVIGTMNTADRSVVALDAALRRRFRFVEVGPDPSVLPAEAMTIGGRPYSLREIMKTINNRIEFLRDRDHLVGHSYFLKMKTAADVAEQFRTGIIPLLREYFYEDLGQLQLILGTGFVSSKPYVEKQLFPGSYALDPPITADGNAYVVNELTGIALADAIDVLLTGKTPEA